MNLEDPITAYNAESNMDAMLVQRFLESEGIQAFAIEDNSLVGHWLGGHIPELHKPQVWISRKNSEKASQLLAEYERKKRARNEDSKADEPQDVNVQCEDCGKESRFAGSLVGTVQDCSHCGSYVDVGEAHWPFEEESGEPEDH